MSPEHMVSTIGRVDQSFCGLDAFVYGAPGACERPRRKLYLKELKPVESFLMFL